MKFRIPVTFLIPVHNEESRIRPVLSHAVLWADEVLVADKGSTDATRDICREYGEKVRVLELPFAPKGHDDFVSLVKEAANDWIYVGTASEIPTRKLVERFRKIIDDTGGTLDVVWVPRKVYSLGVHSPLSPWSVYYTAFLFNRKKAIVQNVIHNNFLPRHPLNVARVEYAEDCCIHHFTHPTAAAYIRDMAQYFPAEVDATAPDALRRRRDECMAQIERFADLREKGGESLFGQYCAWQIYWLGTALFLWEKERCLDVPTEYAAMKNVVLAREWQQTGEGSPAVAVEKDASLPAPSASSSPGPDSCSTCSRAPSGASSRSMAKRAAGGVAATWIRITIVTLAGLIQTPVLFRCLPPHELGVWYLFFTVATFINLSDFGLPAAFGRAVSYLWGKKLSGARPQNLWVAEADRWGNPAGLTNLRS